MALTRPATFLLPTILVATATPARAEGDRALSVGLGWATFSVPGVPADDNMEPPAVTPDVGGTLGLVYEHAVGSDVSLRAELAGALFHGGNTGMQSAMSYAALGDAGIVFRFDVLKYEPYEYGGLGVVTSSGGPIQGGTDLVLAVGGGLDILVDRARSWGIEGRLASFGGDITIFTLGVRVTRRWGYF